MLKLLNERILGPSLIIIVTLSGLFFLFYLSFYPFRRPRRMLAAMKGKEGFKTACLSLSGTLGVGNISGVASAIIVGGAGSIFWMWVFAFLSMLIKYSEIVLSHCHRGKDSCGAAYYIEKGLGSKAFAVIFSILIVISSFGIGNMVQSSAAAQSMKYCFGTPKIVTGVIFSVITLLLITGGRERVSFFSSLVIPILSVGYLLISLSIIISNFSVIPSVFKTIILDAFSVRSATGGFFGVLFADGVRLGATRGILSNESGCGTSAYAQNPVNEEAIKHGIWGIFEVFVDTIVLCTLTALVVLVVPNSINNGMSSVIYSFSYFGEWGGNFVGLSSWIYALASVVCWSYYGISAMKYLIDKKIACGLYLLLYSAAGIIGSVFAPELVWEISDITVSVMAIFNIICVLILSKTVKNETKNYFS